MSQALIEKITDKDDAHIHNTFCKKGPATIVAVCGGFRISCCVDEACQARAIQKAVSFAGAKKDTDAWEKNPRRAARDLRRMADRIK